jgi:hypothetical protein
MVLERRKPLPAEAAACAGALFHLGRGFGGSDRQAHGRAVHRGNGARCRHYSANAKHGFKDETEAGITMKLKRGTFSATFFLACIAAMELEGVVLEEI